MRVHETGQTPRPPHAALAALAFLALAAGASSHALAQAPPRQVCDQLDSGERIKCKFGNVVEQQRGAAEMLEAMGMLPPGQEEVLLSQVDRSSRAHGRSGPMDFKQLTRKSQVSCQIKEAIGDGKGDDDGICAAGEDCAEVLGDQIGNDDGICKPRNGMNREVCVELCDATGINSNPENFDDDPNGNTAGADLEGSLDELTDQYEEINMTLATAPFDGGQVRRATVAAGACAAVHRARPSSTLVAALVGAAEGARVAADVGERFCDQAAFGFSGSSACAVVEGIAGAARVIATSFEFEVADIDSTTIDSIWACLVETSDATTAAVGAVADVGGDLSAVSLQVGNVDARVDGVDQKVVALDQKVAGLQQEIAQVRQSLAEVVHLLSTPPGRRPGFPADGEAQSRRPAPVHRSTD